MSSACKLFVFLVLSHHIFFLTHKTCHGHEERRGSSSSSSSSSNSIGRSRGQSGGIFGRGKGLFGSTGGGRGGGGATITKGGGGDAPPLSSSPPITKGVKTATTTDIATAATIATPSTVLYVTKRSGETEALDRSKIFRRLESLSFDLNLEYMNLDVITDSIIRGLYPNITSEEIDVLAAETIASMSTQHYDYTKLAARILISNNHKGTPGSFSQAIEELSNTEKPFIDPRITRIVHKYSDRIDNAIRNERDFDSFTYFGFKTLQRAYLLKTNTGQIVERPQYLFMRVALGLHCCSGPSSLNTITDDDQEEEKCLQLAFETYEYMSRGYFTHASPALFHSGTTHPQLSSCFLVQMTEDSIQGIYDTLKLCAVISKSAGGIGLSVHNIRSRGTPILGTRGTSNGLVPMLRVFDVTSRYVDQGGGKRPGAFAIYLEPWHADIFDVLNLKKNHGKEEQRARNLFYGLWIPDLFMKRVMADETWSLMSPNICGQQLQNVYGKEFEELYEKYEQEICPETGKPKYVMKQVRARELWTSILESQIETGTPYMLYKDSCNKKSNQQNLGTIQSSNLCCEIIQYTSPEEVAVCNLASLCLPSFVVSNRGRYGSIVPPKNQQQNDTENKEEEEDDEPYFDHEALHAVTKVIARNLNNVIDINQYPVAEAKTSNQNHRPIGIGVSGLADTFIRLGLPFTSPKAKQLNKAIFETIYHAALEASLELSKEHGNIVGKDGDDSDGTTHEDNTASGSYPSFMGSPASQGKLQFDLWKQVKREQQQQKEKDQKETEAQEEEEEEEEHPSHQYFNTIMKQKQRQQSSSSSSSSQEEKINVYNNNNNIVKQKYSDKLMSDHNDNNNCGGYNWDALKEEIKRYGLRNSLLVAPMPTASTSQILGVNECFEPFSSNLYIRRVKAGEFIMINPHLIADLVALKLWNPTVRNELMLNGGSIQTIDAIPSNIKELYKTVWEIKMKDIIDMSADRGTYIDQSQSLNLFIAEPTMDKLTAMHFYAWKKGLKTGMYYLRTKPAVNAIQYTVEKTTTASSINTNNIGQNTNNNDYDNDNNDDESPVCLSCQA